MDLINQILDIVKSSQNPEMYYLAVAVAVILIFYIINKVIKIVTFFLIVGAIALGFGIIQNGGDVKALYESIATPVQSFVSEMQKNNTSNTNGTSTSTSGQSGGGFQKAISDMLAKFKTK